MAVAFENVPKEFVTETAFYDYKTPVTEVLGKLNIHEAVVLLKDDEYYGILDNRSLTKKHGIRFGKRDSAGKYAVKAPFLDKETRISKAIHYFYETGVKALPYLESGKVTGVVKREEILKAILSLHMLSAYKVNEVMSTPVIAIDAGKTIVEARAMMKQSNINRLLVTSNGEMRGMVSYNDILQNAAKLRERGSTKLENAPPPATKISEITEINVRSIKHDESVDTAIRDLVEKEVSALLVLRNGKPVGIISVRDVFEAAMKGNVAAAEGIVISGIDESTRQYEADVRDTVEKFIERIDKFSRLKVKSISVHLRKQKVRNYEIQIRLWLERGGAVSVHSQGYSVEFTLNDALEKMYNAIKNEKEIIYMERRQHERPEEEE